VVKCGKTDVGYDVLALRKKEGGMRLTFDKGIQGKEEVDPDPRNVTVWPEKIKPRKGSYEAEGGNHGP